MKTDKVRMYDNDNNIYNVEIKKVMEHYIIYVDDEFWATAENWHEVDDEINSIKYELHLHY